MQTYNKGSKNEYEDDGRVVADMSDIEPQPMLIPNLKHILGRGQDGAGRSGSGAGESHRSGLSEGRDARRGLNPEPVQLDREGRRAAISGALAAALLVGLAFALGFGAIILLITQIGSP